MTTANWKDCFRGVHKAAEKLYPEKATGGYEDLVLAARRVQNTIDNHLIKGAKTGNFASADERARCAKAPREVLTAYVAKATRHGRQDMVQLAIKVRAAIEEVGVATNPPAQKKDETS